MFSEIYWPEMEFKNACFENVDLLGVFTLVV